MLHIEEKNMAAIRTESEVKNQQEDILLLHIVAEVNDTKFNGSKFLLLIPVDNEEIKNTIFA